MELSLRDAKARFSEVAEAASRGERVVVTKHGKPFVEMVPPREAGGFDFDRAAQLSRLLDPQARTAEELWPAEFDEPAFSRKVLGLE